MDLAPGEPGRAAAERCDRIQRRHVHHLGDAVAQRFPRTRGAAAERRGARGARPGTRSCYRKADRGRRAVAATAVIALLPLSAAAARPRMTPDTPPLSAWLEAHGLRYGVAGYWDASVATVESGNKVQLRAIDLHPHPDAPKWTVNIPGWESNPLWYNPSTYDATFAVADVNGSADGHPGYPAERVRVRSSASRRPATRSTAGTSWSTRRTYCAKLAPYCPDRGAARRAAKRASTWRPAAPEAHCG